MAYFVIAGKPDCVNFNHALYVNNYLQEHLPHFKSSIIERVSGEWESFLEATNRKYRWHHVSSPLIWKEICYRGGRAYLIGGLSEFWEYCYDYYGLCSNIPLKDLIALTEEHLEFLKKSSEEVSAAKPLNICISGASNPMLRVLLPELCNIRYHPNPSVIAVKLYDRHAEKNENAQFIKTIKEEFEVLDTAVLKTVETIDIISDGLKQCDIFIIADYFRPNEIKDRNDKIIKKMSLMLLYADGINAFAKRNIKIILIDDGPVCFNATVLVEACTRIRISNIVAITSDVGLRHLTEASRQTGVPVKELGAPPVWGFIGVNEFVDLDSIVQYSEVYIPYKRAESDVKESTLPPGKTKAELRLLAYLIKDKEEILERVKKRKSGVLNKLKVQPAYAKVRATSSLLKLWYAKEESDDIVSLGICSKGAFGLHCGIVFSQPCMLNKRRMWTPFESFPLTNLAKSEIEKLVSPTKMLLDEYGVCGTNNVPNYEYI